jgi:hypothetical protein
MPREIAIADYHWRQAVLTPKRLRHRELSLFTKRSAGSGHDHMFQTAPNLRWSRHEWTSAGFFWF